MMVVGVVEIAAGATTSWWWPVLEAEHLCMTVRGVQAPGVRTVTSAPRGRVRDDPRTRAEFLALATTGR
jgi:GTP cyclohydrolase I